jgi:bifunctional UDP-N-acetylglucosamine pyrophosphorylase/glucosamine-1-phosphate N-acetyltransferase
MDKQAAVILVAGKGTRMKSGIPKALHLVCGKEMVTLIVDSVRAAGINRIVVVVAPESDSIKAILGNDVNYVEQTDQLGTGHALLQAREVLEGVSEITVLAGDTPLIRSGSLESLARIQRDNSALITILTAVVGDPSDLGRIVRDDKGINAVIEHYMASPEDLKIREVNSGAYRIKSSWLWPVLKSLQPSSNGEVLLTDLVAVAAADRSGSVTSVTAQDPTEILGINDRVQLAAAEKIMRGRICKRLMLKGVTIPDPQSVYIDINVEIGEDAIVMPNTHVLGQSIIGRGCRIGPNSIIKDSSIGDGCSVSASAVTEATLENEVEIGPFSNVRSGTYLESYVNIGTTVELKKTRIGRNSKVNHFSYIGDADIGSEVNIGAGTITCNYDGIEKHSTRIGDGALIGSDTMLVAPVDVGSNARTGTGAIVTNDVPEGTLVVGSPARVKKKELGRGLQD